MSVEEVGSEKKKKKTFFSACVIGAGDVGQDCSPSPLHRSKYTRFAWAGGTFFPVVLYVVSVFGSGGKKVLVYICMYHLEYNTIQLWCCVSFLVTAGNSFWSYVHT